MLFRKIGDEKVFVLNFEESTRIREFQVLLRSSGLILRRLRRQLFFGLSNQKYPAFAKRKSSLSERACPGDLYFELPHPLEPMPSREKHTAESADRMLGLFCVSFSYANCKD